MTPRTHDGAVSYQQAHTPQRARRFARANTNPLPRSATLTVDAACNGVACLAYPVPEIEGVHAFRQADLESGAVSTVTKEGGV